MKIIDILLRVCVCVCVLVWRKRAFDFGNYCWVNSAMFALVGKYKNRAIIKYVVCDLVGEKTRSLNIKRTSIVAER